MLSLDDKNKYKAAWEQTIDTLGVPCTFMSKTSGTVNCVAGFKTTRDEEIVNAYGIGSKVITIRAMDVPEVTKLGSCEIGPERYTFDAVLPVHLIDQLLGWRCVV
jgi:hypothetical protein